MKRPAVAATSRAQTEVCVLTGGEAESGAQGGTQDGYPAHPKENAPRKARGGWSRPFGELGLRDD